MADTNNPLNIRFLKGTQANLDAIKNDSTKSFTPGAFYLTEDSERLYYAKGTRDIAYLNKYITTVDAVSNLPETANIGDFYYIKSGNILCFYNGGTGENDGDTISKWTQVNVDTLDTDTKVSAISISRSGKDTDSINYAYSLSQVNKSGTSIGTPLSGTFEISKADINALVTQQTVDVTVAGDKTDATDTKATIKTKLSGSNSEDSFSIEEGSNINIEVTDSTSSAIGNIKINAVDTKYDLSSAANATTIVLKEGDGSEQDTITFAAGTSNSDIIVSGDTANKIDIAHKTYNTKTASGVTDKTGVGRTGTFKVLKDVTVSNGHVTGVTTANITLAIPEDTNTYVTAVKADNAGKITITQNEGEKIVSGADLYYTIGSNTYYNQADITSAIKNLIKDNFSTLTNALTFKGSISNGTLPTSASIGDTYIVKTNNVVTTTDGTAKHGDILIANGTESTSTGFITGTIEWIVVPGTELDTTYTITSDTTNHKLYLNASTDVGETIPANRTICVSDDNYVNLEIAANNTIKATHKGYTARNITGASDTTLTHTTGDKTFKAITGFTSDSKGHVTGVTSTTYTLPQLPDQTNNHHFTTDSTNKKVILNSADGNAQDSIQFVAGTALSVAVATDKNDQDKVTYSHGNVTCTHTNSTSSTTDITGSGQNVISSITVNDQGHVTAYTTKKYKSTNTDTKYTLSGATVGEVTNGVSITDTLKTTVGEASGTSAFNIISSNPTNLTVSKGTGAQVSLGLVWGTF